MSHDVHQMTVGQYRRRLEESEQERRKLQHRIAQLEEKNAIAEKDRRDAWAFVRALRRQARGR